jgi:deoxyribonuclease-4
MVGSHIKKLKTYYLTFNSLEGKVYLDSYPMQIFSGSTKMWKRSKIDEKDVEKTKIYIKEKNIKAFIHSIYLINLSRTGEEFEKAREVLEYDLKLGSMMGMSGVVVHVGKSLKMNKTDAINNMYKNIILLLDIIDESCPLLIETPAGQGTEILTELDDFCRFYENFSLKDRKKVKLCLDTCHIFASSDKYKPIEYLENVYNKFPNSIVLVHYNDSKCKHGSKKDRHEVPGLGYIGFEDMEKIYQWCFEKKIPMVVE